VEEGMSELVANEYGVEFDHIKITKLRIHRTDGKWLVEYRREPRWFLGLDRWWWFDDGTYIDYSDASARVDTLLGIGFVSKAQFQTVKEFEVE
jgi:hypothetical protein